MTKMHHPRLALTLGEPAGIGPDICLMLAQEKLPAQLVVIASADLLLARAKELGLSITLEEFKKDNPSKPNGEGKLSIIDIPLNKKVQSGQLDVSNSAYVLKTLDLAASLCQSSDLHAMVTGPIHKAIISQSGVLFSGHTEYLRDLVGAKSVLMTFHTPEFMLGMTTTHHPLKSVSEMLTEKKLDNALALLHEGFAKFFNKQKPCIHVLGLNPHAGENGTLGTEEETMIKPLIKKWQQQGFNVVGPLSADTAFIAKNRHGADAILAMYHDQGLAPLKSLFFGQIVNVTFGLPFLRTSVDHGTALDIAGTGKADPNSLLQAITLAAKYALS